MPFLRINGVTVPVVVGGTQSRTPIGDNLETEGNFTWLRRRRPVAGFSFTTTPITSDVAEAIEAIVGGHCHVWPFTATLFSSRGLPPASVTGNTIVAGGKFGTKVTVTTSLSYQIRRGISAVGDGHWTVFVWRLESGVWVHYVIRDDGALWMNGVRNDGTAALWFRISAGVLRLAAGDYDDMMLVPARVPMAMVADLYAFTATGLTAWPLAPQVAVSGDALAPLSGGMMVGEVGRQDVLQGAWPTANPDGTFWRNNARRVALSLSPHDVEPA